MHHIYHTEGVVLHSRNFGEAGKYFFVLTKDLGAIRASAQGIRKLSSKLRFVLQEGAYLKIDLVKGKDFWRITNVSKTGVLENICKNRETFLIFTNLSRLLKRLLPGEEANAKLFSDFLNGLIILEKSKTKEDLRNIEAIVVLRILGDLGYIGEDKIMDNLVKSPFEEDLIPEISRNRTKILREINKALKETHL